MPIKKYRVETDKGAYMVEVDEPTPASPIPHASYGDITEDPSQDPGKSGKLVELKNMMQQTVHPQSLGDLLPMLIPEIPNVPALFRSIKGMGGAAMEGAANAPTIRSMPRLALKAMNDRANRFIPQSGPVGAEVANAAAVGGKVAPTMGPMETVPVKLGGAEGIPMENGGRSIGPSPNPATKPIPRPLDAPGVPSVPPKQKVSAPQGADIPIPDRGRFNEPPQRATGIDSSNTTTPPALRKWNEKPSLDEVLQQALQEVAAPEKPSLVSGAPEPTTAAGGPHTGKVRKGQGKGFDSGNPSTRPMDSPLDPTNPNAGEPAPWDPEWATKMPGETTPPPTPKPDTSGGAFGSTENPEWHSGKENDWASKSSHNYEGQMDAGYKRRTEEERAMFQELLRQLGQE